MILVARVEEMRNLDAVTIKEIGIPSLVLMENAGRGIVDELQDSFGDLHGLEIVIVCGSGNNGGDGLVAARYLDSLGADVELFLTCEERGVKGDAKTQLKLVENLGMPVRTVAEKKSLSALKRSLAGADVVIDAILGTGARGNLSGHLNHVVSLLNESQGFRVAVDAPTGVEMDAGALLGEAFDADLTVTFGLPKRGHFLYPGRAFCGRLAIVDIGIPRRALENAGISLVFMEEEDARSLLPVRPPDAHKGSCGTVLIVAGSEGFTGAAALAGQAALKCGAGLVHLGIPASLNDILEAKLTEVITKPLEETEVRSLSSEGFDRIIELAGKAKCVALGPGLGRHPDTQKLVRKLLMRLDLPVVLDADGINAIAGSPDILRKRKWPTVITPHPGELGRLIGESPATINADRVEYARRYAKEWDVVLLLKGAPTVTAHPVGFACINSTGNAGLASGGTGDVLTGAIASFITQGCDPLHSAVAGAYFHGLAADEASSEIGEIGLSAEDVLEFLPYVIEHGTEDEDEEGD
jgi:hydroxyethylthiazole kinase-like uncharacterized protein yjeF